MKFTSKNTTEGWGMGFLLVFFPEEHQNQEHKKKPNNFIPQFPSNSTHLLQKAQSTISICLLILFTTVLLFTISTLPSSSATASAAARRLYRVPRRHLVSKLPEASIQNLPHALQGMGTLYRRGSRGMSDLVVAHAVESLTQPELRLFLRLFHRSTLASKSDLLFIFGAKSVKFDKTIVEENDSFLKLLTRYTSGNDSHSLPSFDVTQFTKMGKKEKASGEPIWGRRIRSNFSEESRIKTESKRPSYGSVIGFDLEELDPENSLSGFLDHIPMSLRRWACYPMLLGRVRRNFKHIILLDAKEFLILGDPLGRVRNQSPESVILKGSTQSTSSKHGRKNNNSDKTQSTRQKQVHSGIILGGSRGIRRLSNTMLMDIVRASMQQHKKKNSVTESGLFNQLVGNDFVLKNVNLIVSAESVPEVSSLSGSSSKSGSHYSVIRRGNSNLDVNSVVMKHLCSFPIDSTVYSEC